MIENSRQPELHEALSGSQGVYGVDSSMISCVQHRRGCTWRKCVQQTEKDDRDDRGRGGEDGDRLQAALSLSMADVGAGARAQPRSRWFSSSKGPASRAAGSGCSQDGWFWCDGRLLGNDRGGQRLNWCSLEDLAIWGDAVGDQK